MAVTRQVSSDSGHCVGCHESFDDGEITIGVVTGAVEGEVITPKHIDWYHTACWQSLPQRE